MILSETPKIEVFNMDCMEYIASMPDKAFGLAIVDPPYGIGNFSQENKKNRPHSRPWDIQCNESIPDKNYFDQLIKISENRIIWGANYYNCFDSLGGSIIWDKGNESPVGSQAEIASTNLFSGVLIYKEKWTGFINSENAKTWQKIHPCQKPIKLYRWILKEFALPGWKIFDSHLGSGSSAIAAHQMGFDFVGCEIDKDYFDASVKRFYEQTAQKSLFNKY